MSCVSRNDDDDLSAKYRYLFIILHAKLIYFLETANCIYQKMRLSAIFLRLWGCFAVLSDTSSLKS
ncbi:hypothetical protein HMPREF9999_00610 [Alloprevotella sp. oral taxon 473 str. F0040]|nr:hypothetical protein HMPREF9999_00610 [Alloprevotella sp. oral taxon 473 str. F0040]